MSLRNFLRRTLKDTPLMPFIRRFEDFLSVHFPKIYNVLWEWHNEVKYTDCGEKILLQMRKYPPVYRLKKIFDYSISLPLNFHAEISEKKVAAVVHLFYPEMSDEIKNLLNNIPNKVDVYISTVSEEKKSAIEKNFSDFAKGKVCVKVFENRGRDIAPAFVGFKNIYKNYDLCVHLHSKKSPHAKNRLFGWKNYLYDNLLGSEEIVRGIFKIMENEKVGVVFPQYFSQIRISINWGENYFGVKNFLSRLNISSENLNLLEFPAGSMFWFKPAALKPIFESGITFEDFPEESGQTDGTFAHAIERAFLYVAESENFSWIKICTQPKLNGDTPILKSDTPQELNENIKKVWHKLSEK